MAENVKIYIACHQPSPVPQHPFLFPIQVGSILTQERFSGMLMDDTGENISERNRSYCELTALYWAWKKRYRRIGRGCSITGATWIFDACMSRTSRFGPIGLRTVPQKLFCKKPGMNRRKNSWNSFALMKRLSLCRRKWVGQRQNSTSALRTTMPGISAWWRNCCDGGTRETGGLRKHISREQDYISGTCF